MLNFVKKKQALIFSLCFFFVSFTLRARDANERAQVVVEEVKHDAQAKKEVPKYKDDKTKSLDTSLEKELIDGIDESLIYLKKTVQGIPAGSKSREKMLTKILNLLLEQSAYLASEEQKKYDDEWDDWNHKGKKGKEPVLNNEKSRGRWIEVVQNARLLLKEFPQSSNASQINFNEALSLQFLGKTEESIQSFHKLIKNFPKSPSAGDAYFSIGDYYFDHNQFKDAAKNYIEATQYKESSRYGWAFFKLGWCYFNLNDHQRSIDSWKKTVQVSKTLDKEKGVRLQEEALRDIAFAFAELKQMNEAMAFYKSQGGSKYLGKFLKIIANIYKTQGEFEHALDAYRKVTRLMPLENDTLDAQSEIIALFFERKDYKNTFAELKKLHEHFGPGSEWFEKNKDSAGEVAKKIKNAIVYYPKIIHRDAQKLNQIALYEWAKKGYIDYLHTYKESHDLVEIKEYVADIEYFLKNYQQAGNIYYGIASLGKDKAQIVDEKGKVVANIHQRSAKNMLDAYNKDYLSELQALLKVVPNFKEKPKPLSKQAKNFIAACQNYVNWYPADVVNVKNCDIFKSEIYYRLGYKNKASELLKNIALKYSKNPEGKIAVENLIPLFTDNKKALAGLVEKLLEVPEYKVGPLGERLNKLTHSLQLEMIAEEKDILTRASLYEKFASKNPQDKQVDKIWNNAASEYMKAGDVLKALGSYIQIIEHYPNSQAYQSSLLQVAKLFDKRFNFQKARGYYELYAKKFPQTKEAPGAWQRSCLLSLVSEEKASEGICLSFSKAYPEVGKGIVLKLINNAWRTHRTQDAMTLTMNHYLPAFKVDVNERIVVLYKIYHSSNGSSPDSLKAGQMILSLSKSAELSGESLRYVGEIVFRNVDGIFAGFEAQNLKGGNVNNLQTSIQAIFSSIANLEQSYNKVFEVKDSFWGVAAFARLGKAYSIFSEKLENPPAIQGAKTQDVKNQLKGSIDQLKAKSLEMYTSGMKIALEFQVYNEWVLKLQDGLNQLKGKTLKSQDWVVVPQVISGELKPSQLLDYVGEY